METQNASNINYKLYKMSRLAPAKVKKEVNKIASITDEMPTIKIQSNEEERDNHDLMRVAFDYWSSLRDVRDRSIRTYKYLTSDQWHERINDPLNDGDTITEKENITRRGRPAIQNNIMAQIRNNLVGRFMSNKMKPLVIARGKANTKKSEMMTNALRHVHSLNAMHLLYAQNFDNMAISGLPISKVGYQWMPERNTFDVFIQNINLYNFFFNTDIQDIRHTDLRLVGELLDTTLDEIISVFARNEADKTLIESWYPTTGGLRNGVIDNSGLNKSQIENIDFYQSTDTVKARVIVIWYKKSEWRTRVHDYLTGEDYVSPKSLEEVQQENLRRIADAAVQGIPQEEVPLKEASRIYETFWYCKYLTPNGKCLYEGETPYWHESHPYEFYTYPLINGEVRGAYEDIIEQQRYINRLIIMIDAMMGTLTKGTLLVPEDSIPDDMDIDDFAEEWSKIGGVIMFKAKPGAPLPQQVQSNISNIGAMDMLALQIKLMQEISGINYAIQGQKATAGTPASLYAQEAMNSAVNSKYIMDSYAEFMKRLDYKALKVAHQYYEGERLLAIAGDSYSDTARIYNAADVQGFDFEYELTQSTDTPTFRQITDDILLKFLEMQAIDLETYLEHSTMPFAQGLLDTIKTKREQMMQQQAGMAQGAGGGQLPPEVMSIQQPEFSPDARNVINKMMEREVV